MRITIVADASFCHDTTAAGWAGWAKRDGWDNSLMRGGPLKRRPGTPQEAELAALVNMVHVVSKYDTGLEGITAMWLQSDCIGALELIFAFVPKVKKAIPKLGVAMTGKYKTTATPYEMDALIHLKLMLEPIDEVHVRHVKGHAAGGSSRWVNRQCDQLAKKYMREQRKTLKAEKVD